MTVTLTTGTIYWLGSAPSVLFGDGGELQFAAWTAGLPHPTGYPLYMLLGWAWTHLLHGVGLASPARAMNLLSVLFAALAVGLVYLFALAILELSMPKVGAMGQRLAGLVPALTFAFTPTFWSQALVTEVYALNAVFVALLLGLAVRWLKQLRLERSRGEPGPLTFRSRPTAPLAVMALTLGLSLAHHRTTLLLVPVLVLYVWRQDGYRLRRPIWLITLGLLATLPLLLYLYIPLRVPHTPYLRLELDPGRPIFLIEDTPAGLLRYALGQTFAGQLQGIQAALAGIPGLLNRFVTEFGAPAIGLALLGLLYLAVSGQRRLLWLTGGSFMALAGFNLFYTIDDIHVFYIGPYLIVATWIGLGSAFVALETTQLLEKRLPKQGATHEHARLPTNVALASVVLAVPLLTLPLSLFLAHADRLDQSGHTRPERWWTELLQAGPPQDAILVSNDRDEIMPLWYAQQVDGVRPDLAGVFPGLLPGPDWANVGRVLDHALASGRPTYLIKPMPGLEVKLHTGLNDQAGLTPIQGPAVATAPQRPQDIVLGGVVRLAGYDVAPLHPEPGKRLNISLYWQPLQQMPANFSASVQVLNNDGRKVAQSDRLLGGVYYPTSLWQPGEMLLDRHQLAIPAGSPPGPYQLLVSMYELKGQEAASLGSVTLGGRVGGQPPASAQDTPVANPYYANLNDEILLVGYDLAGERLAPIGGSQPSADPSADREVLQIRLLWQAARPMADDYTVFLHLLDEADTIVSQLDAQPFADSYPTSVWAQGELLTDTYLLPVPAAAVPPGRYRIAIGLYLPQRRLPAYDDTGQRLPNDRAELTQVELF